MGQYHGYFVNGSKSWLICKSEELAIKAREVFGNSLNITTEGKRHLGAIIGSQDYKTSYCNEKVEQYGY